MIAEICNLFLSYFQYLLSSKYNGLEHRSDLAQAINLTSFFVTSYMKIIGRPEDLIQHQVGWA